MPCPIAERISVLAGDIVDGITSYLPSRTYTPKSVMLSPCSPPPGHPALRLRSRLDANSSLA